MIEAAQLHYIFTFAFTRIPLGEKVHFDNKSDSLGYFLQEKVQHVKYHESEEEEPVMTRSSIYLPFHHLSIGTEGERINADPFGEGIIEKHIAIFESGMGVMRISFEPLNAPNIELLSQAIRRDGFPLLSSVGGMISSMSEKSIHDYFKDGVLTLLNGINQAIKQLDEKTHLRLLNLYPYPKIASQESDSENLQKQFILRWIDSEKELIWHDFQSEHRRGTGVFQEPSVGLVVKVSQQLRDAIDPAAPQRTQLEHIVSSVLHTNSVNHLDASHALEHEGSHLRNLYPDKRFRMFFHQNCFLVIHSEETSPRLPDYFKEFIYGLFRTYCAVRGCWHMYNIVDAQLEQLINALFLQFAAFSSKTDHYGDFVEQQAEIIRTKHYFLMSLAVEDPLVRTIRLTNFGSLYDSISHAFRVDEIRKIVEYKLHELDRFYDMISSYHLQKSYLPSLDKGLFCIFLTALFFTSATLVSIFYLPKVFSQELCVITSLSFGILSIGTIVWIVVRLIGMKNR